MPLATNPWRKELTMPRALALGLTAFSLSLLALSVATIAAPTAAQTAAPMRAQPAPHPLEGRWTLDAPGRAQTRVERAVEGIVQQMSFFLQDLARSRLRERLEPSRSVEIRFEGASSTVILDDGRFRTPRDGVEVSLERYGATIRLQQWRSDERLVQRFVSDRGTRTDHWRRRGDELHLVVLVESARLPTPVRIDHVYRRAP
jgi:hypothetical protein